MPFSRQIALGLLILGLAGLATAQQSSQATSKTLLVLPFENASQAPGIEWIAESFPEILGQRLVSPGLYVVPREDRLYAYERAGIPSTVHLSRATLFRIAEQMDADYAVLGEYNFDGQTFTAKAHLLELKRLRLSPEQQESGPLPRLIDVQSALAWDLLHSLQPDLLTSREEFLRASPNIRLDALENYIRGITAATQQLKIKHFREAVRLDSTYAPAVVQLAKAYYRERDYTQAAAWFARVPREDSLGREASFYLGLASFYLGDFARAEAAFSFLASRLPLTEVQNNLGVAASRRGKRAALDSFQRAVLADPHDPDYRFNLALALYKAGDTAGAARQLREALALRPNDNEARSLLELVSQPARAEALPSANLHLPLERIKTSYHETSFRQLALEIQNAAELRLANTDPRTHAAFHVERGRDLLEQGFVAEAEKELREAILLDPANAAAHCGLARVLERNQDARHARTEAQASLRLAPSVEAYLLLARLDLKDNQASAAAEHIERALTLEPGNPAALVLKRTVAARLGLQSAP